MNIRIEDLCETLWIFSVYLCEIAKLEKTISQRHKEKN